MTIVPGTFTPGFVEQDIVEFHNPALRNRLKRLGSLGIRFYDMGECRIIKAREPAGANHERLWHLTISCLDRHPTWDEIKTARYRLLPGDLTFGMLLPPTDLYVNVPEQDHVFHLWEITDPRAPWQVG